MSSGIHHRLAVGAALGARSAAIYAALECVAIALAPQLWAPLFPPTRLTAGGLALLVASYTGLGALVGAALGAVFRSELTALATLAVVLGHAAHLARTSAPDTALALSLGVCALAAAALLARARSARPSRPLRALANPWSASLLLIGASALLLGSARRPPAAQLAVALAWTAGVAAGSLGIGWIASRLGRPGPRPVAGLAGAGAALAAAAGLAAWLQRPVAPELPPPPAAAERRPDVVLITLDTVRSDHLSLYGYARDTTPDLEAFARTATLYTRAVAASNLTLPTHASLFTGLYPRHHGALVDPELGAVGLAERFRTLAEVLREAGYLTLAVVANPAYLAARLGFGQGFDHYDDARPQPFLPELRPQLAASSLVALLDAALSDPDLVRAESAYRRADEINRVVFRLLDQVAGRPQPLFLFVNYMDAHWPYDPPPPFDLRYPGRLPRGERPGRAAFLAAQQLRRQLTPAERRHMVSQYDGAIAYLDRALGRLFERLRALGRFDGALVVVTSDHGEALGEHGLLSHGVSLHQHQLHVPLLVKAPQQRAAAVSGVLVSSVDVMPTILAALSLEVPAALPGLDLLGEGGSERVVISESHPGVVFSRSHPRLRYAQRALFAGDLKLIASESGQRQLFDLSADPGELRNRFAGDARAAELEQELARWLSGQPPQQGPRVPLDAETRARLEALGYGR